MINYDNIFKTKIYNDIFLKNYLKYKKIYKGGENDKKIEDIIDNNAILQISDYFNSNKNNIKFLKEEEKPLYEDKIGGKKCVTKKKKN